MDASSACKRGMTRRAFVALAPAIVAAAPLPAKAEPVLGDDGLYHEPWFLSSFLDLRDDLESATSEGKRLAVMWELRGCPYCRETHLVNLADQDIANYIRANFHVLLLNLIGSRKVVDFDGSEATEKELAERYAIRFTPTFQFFPPSSDGLAQKDPMGREVARAPGYLKPQHFLAMFRFVREQAYEHGTFLDYLSASKG